MVIQRTALRWFVALCWHGRAFCCYNVASNSNSNCNCESAFWIRMLLRPFAKSACIDISARAHSERTMSQQHGKTRVTHGWGRWYHHGNLGAPNAVPASGFYGVLPEIPMPTPQYGRSSTFPSRYSYSLPLSTPSHTRYKTSLCWNPPDPTLEDWRRVNDIESQIDHLQYKLKRQGEKSRQSLGLLFLSLLDNQPRVDRIGEH